MPVLKSEIELEDGTKILVRQASGTAKLRLETGQARVFRKFQHYGEVENWTLDQQLEFSDALDQEGCGIVAQIEAWLPDCILDENITVDDLTTQEMMKVLEYVRGTPEIPESAVPLEVSSE